MADPISKSPVERALLATLTSRMSAWLWLSVVLLAVVAYLARHMVGVEVFGVAKLTVAGYLGFVLSLALEGSLKFGPDKALRPHELRAQAVAARKRGAAGAAQAAALDQRADAMLNRRALIVAACLIASGIGA